MRTHFLVLLLLSCPLILSACSSDGPMAVESGSSSWGSGLSGSVEAQTSGFLVVAGAELHGPSEVLDELTFDANFESGGWVWAVGGDFPSGVLELWLPVPPNTSPGTQLEIESCVDGDCQLTSSVRVAGWIKGGVDEPANFQVRNQGIF